MTAMGQPSAETVLDALRCGDFKKRHLTQALSFGGRAQAGLFALARQRRDVFFPERKVEARSVIEISNICRQKCNFCNMHASAKIFRYAIDPEACAKTLRFLYSKKGRRVFLIQSGENPTSSYIESVSKCIKHFKKEASDAVIILCLGNLSDECYRRLREAGADRYLLKFETSNPALYERIKPGDSLNERIDRIYRLHALGFEVGSGNMTGLPGQSIRSMIDDLIFLGKLPLTTMSTSVFIPGERSRYRQKPVGDVDVTLNFMALMRMMYPGAIIPSTSSMEKARKGTQYLGLMAGANSVTIHDGNPVKFKKNFPIYSTHRITPGEPCIKKIVKKARLFFFCQPLAPVGTGTASSGTRSAS
jgi:biotin synthase